MAFKAKKESICQGCQWPIQIGQYLTWSRATKATYHIECWRKTPQYAEWKAKQSQGHTQQTEQAQEQGQTTETATEFPKPIPMPIIELKEDSMTKDSDNQALDILGQAIWARIEPKVSNLDGVRSDFEAFKLDVQETITSAIEKAKSELPKPTVIEIKDYATGETKDLGIQHKTFPTLVKMLQARDHQGHRLNIWLTGPAGTGKSKGVENAAKALGMPFFSMGSIVESYKFLGHTSPGTGEYIPTMARQAWEFGGLLCMDDFDGSDPNCIVELLGISNGLFAFPDKMVPRHPDFCLVLTANTWGLGGTNDYVGRMKQDAAFINRFVSLHWDIDEEMERATCSNPLWARQVQKVRAKVKAKGIKVMITPRQSYQGAALLATGMEQDEVESIVLRQSMTPEQWESVS